MKVISTAASLPSIRNAVGLVAEFTPHGSLRSIRYGDTCITMFPANGVEPGATALYLRRLQDGVVQAHTNVLALQDGMQWRINQMQWQCRGHWQGLDFELTLKLSADAPVWFWHVAIVNSSAGLCSIDLVMAQDVALAAYDSIRVNEYYISQYLDHTPLTHVTKGVMLATRQNLADKAGHNPWLLTGSLRRAIHYATDGLQVLGTAQRSGGLARLAQHALPSQRLQHEHAMQALQDAAIELEAGALVHCGYFSGMVAHREGATSAGDAAYADAWLALAQAAPSRYNGVVQHSDAQWQAVRTNVFTNASQLVTQPFSETELQQYFTGAWGQIERRADNALLSFFTDDSTHVVLAEKERQVLRPHGHILRTGNHLVPDEESLTSTCWMAGGFHTMLTQGHVSANRLFSTVRGYLGLQHSAGQRVWAHIGGRWQLLGVPSAFSIAQRECRWLYRHQGGVIEVCSSASLQQHTLQLNVRVLTGAACAFLVTHHIALHGDDGLSQGAPVWQTRTTTDVHSDTNTNTNTNAHMVAVDIYPPAGSAMHQRFPTGCLTLALAADSAGQIEAVGGDAMLFHDGQSADLPFVCLQSQVCKQFALTLSSTLVGAPSCLLQALPTLGSLQLPRVAAGGSVEAGIGAISAAAQASLAAVLGMLPWMQNNALVHYLAPRGLEQFTGGGWGTRDVCQGPVELLLAQGCVAPVRDLLLRVFTAQQSDGDWPQWFMFFARDRLVRAGDSHGDIVFWPLLALGQYLIASGDATILDEAVPYFSQTDPALAARVSIWQHAQRALAVIAARQIPATHLAAYGHGDWNDSLQPADPRLREVMCSAWTVTLHYQVLHTLGQALHMVGRSEQAQDFAAMAQQVLHDFQQHLMPQGVVAGYALFEPDQATRYVLHPCSDTVPARYSLLPMIHAIINSMLDKDQAAAHLHIIQTHLQGPDGARLFDRPFAYKGGVQTLFQRAESSSFFGREIGLMYTHAHLRYCEALAHYGDAAAFFAALCQVIPSELQKNLKQARLRQLNCYYSSSDAEFADRYDSVARYDDMLAGDVPLEGGWRVYSSGAGITLSLVLRQLLGLRSTCDSFVFDPVLPATLDGLHIESMIGTTMLRLRYHVGAQGCGVSKLVLNGKVLDFVREANPYRSGAASVSRMAWQAVLEHTPDFANADQPAQLEIHLG